MSLSRFLPLRSGTTRPQTSFSRVVSSVLVSGTARWLGALPLSLEILVHEREAHGKKGKTLLAQVEFPLIGSNRLPPTGAASTCVLGLDLCLGLLLLLWAGKKHRQPGSDLEAAGPEDRAKRLPGLLVLHFRGGETFLNGGFKTFQRDVFLFVLQFPYL